jgi:protein-S-isoprenylcysteine O-methyltransferase Ste14
MVEKGVNTYLVFAVSLVATSIAALFSYPMGFLFCFMNICALVLETLVLKFSRKDIFKRKLSLQDPWDRYFVPLIVLGAVASAVVSAFDITSARVSVLPAWTFLPGIVLLMSGYLILTQALRSYPPHAFDKYGEAAAEDSERGPYEVVRHPIMLAVLLVGLSIPLFLSSGIGFIPDILLIIAVIARVAMEDDWRFNNYEWFYDYTKEVSFRLIPFIW